MKLACLLNFRFIYIFFTKSKYIGSIFLRFRGVTDSTNDFGSFSQGSNPCGTATKSTNIYFLQHCKIYQFHQKIP
jgi:hypothetical protein